MPEEAPIREGEVWRDWEGGVFTVLDVRMIGDGDDWFFDAKYQDDGREVRNFIWTEKQFTPVTEESK